MSTSRYFRVAADNRASTTSAYRSAWSGSKALSAVQNTLKIDSRSADLSACAIVDSTASSGFRGHRGIGDRRDLAWPQDERRQHEVRLTDRYRPGAPARHPRAGTDHQQHDGTAQPCVKRGDVRRPAAPLVTIGAQ